MSPTTQCSEKKICGTLSFSVYNSTVSLHQLRSEDIFHTELAVFFRAMQKKIPLFLCVILEN